MSSLVSNQDRDVMKRAPEEGRSRRSEGVEGPGQRQGPGRESRRRQPTAGMGCRGAKAADVVCVSSGFQIGSYCHVIRLKMAAVPAHAEMSPEALSGLMGWPDLRA